MHAARHAVAERHGAQSMRIEAESAAAVRARNVAAASGEAKANADSETDAAAAKAIQALSRRSGARGQRPRRRGLGERRACELHDGALVATRRASPRAVLRGRLRELPPALVGAR